MPSVAWFSCPGELSPNEISWLVFRIVPVPFRITTPGPEPCQTLTTTRSSGSGSSSPLTGTVSVFSVSPGAKVSEPWGEGIVKSTPRVAVVSPETSSYLTCTSVSDGFPVPTVKTRSVVPDLPSSTLGESIERANWSSFRMRPTPGSGPGRYARKLAWPSSKRTVSSPSITSSPLTGTRTVCRSWPGRNTRLRFGGAALDS